MMRYVKSSYMEDLMSAANKDSRAESPNRYI